MGGGLVAGDGMRAYHVHLTRAAVPRITSAMRCHSLKLLVAAIIPLRRQGSCPNSNLPAFCGGPCGRFHPFMKANKSCEIMCCCSRPASANDRAGGAATMSGPCVSARPRPLAQVRFIHLRGSGIASRYLEVLRCDLRVAVAPRRCRATVGYNGAAKPVLRGRGQSG